MYVVDQFSVPTPGALDALWRHRHTCTGRMSCSALTSRVLYPGSTLRQSGLEFRATGTVDENVPLPTPSLRGVPFNYAPSRIADNAIVFEP